jgi:hypothetical protein
MRENALYVEDLGVILYSPPAVSHIQAGSDYVTARFWRPEDVARHVMACRLTTFATGSPGSFRLRFHDAAPDGRGVTPAQFALRLGLRVESGVICVRDLFDLRDRSPSCPPEQRLPTIDGWYWLTVLSSAPATGVLGDDQLIEINLEMTDSRPRLRWHGVPQLCPPDSA